MTNSFRLSPQFSLVLITMIWGGTFLTVKYALSFGDPLYFIALRFGTAAFFIALLMRRDLGKITGYEWFAGSLIGVFLFLGYTLQTYGLQTISSSRSAFITAFAVPMVPLFQWLLFCERPRLGSWIGIALAFTGLVLIAGPSEGATGFSIGVIFTIISAVAIAIEVVLIGWFAGKIDAKRVTFVQLLITAGIACVLIPILQEPAPQNLIPFVAIATLLGLASAVIQMTMNWAQRSVSPTRATIIYSGEPVWAGIIGRIAGDRLPATALIGATMIITAMLVSELSPKKKAP